VAAGLEDIESGAESGGAGFLYQESLTDTAAHHCFDYCLLFDGGGGGGDADNDTGAKEAAFVADLGDKMAEHYFCNFKVCDYTLTQRPGGSNVAGCAAQHALCRLAYSQDLACVLFNGNHGRFMEHNTLASQVDKHRSSAKVNSHIGT
jgi:hypothetical protein